MRKIKGVILGGLLLGLTFTTLTACKEESKVVDFTLNAENVETLLDYNEELDLSSLLLKAEYSDGSIKNIPIDDAELFVDMGGFNKAIPGKYTIRYTYSSIEKSFVVTVGKPEVVGFKIDRGSIPEEVEYGTEIDWTKLDAYAINEDGSMRKLEQSEYTLKSDSYNAYSRGYYTIQVIYQEIYEEFFSVTVNADVIKIFADTTRMETSIEWGGSLDFRRLDVYTVCQGDSISSIMGASEKSEHLTFDYGGYNNKVAGEYTITVKYDNSDSILDSFVVTVAAPKPTGFVIDRSSIPQEVKYNTDVNFNNVKVYETYQDGSQVLLTSGYTIDSSSYNKLKGGNYGIVVSCKDYTSSRFYIRVYCEVVRLFADVENMTDTFDWGQDYSLIGLKLEVEYEDNTRSEISYQNPLISIDDGGYDREVSGLYTFTAKYNNNDEITTTFSIVVSPAREIGFEFDITDVPQVIEIGEELDLTNLKVYALKEDGSSTPVDINECEVNTSEYNKAVVGEYTIYVRYGNYTAQNFKVEVKKLVTELVVENSLEVAWGDNEIDLSSLSVKIIRSESGFDVVSGDSERLIVDLSQVDTTVSGDNTVTVKYKNDETIVTTFTLKVLAAKIVALEVDTTSIGESVEVGSEIDWSLIVVKAVYQDESKIDLQASEYKLDLTELDLTTAGTYEVTVTYLADENISQTFNIVVSESLGE